MQHVSEKNRTPPLAFAASFSIFCSLSEPEQMPSIPNDCFCAAVEYLACPAPQSDFVSFLLCRMIQGDSTSRIRKWWQYLDDLNREGFFLGWVSLTRGEEVEDLNHQVKSYTTFSKRTQAFFAVVGLTVILILQEMCLLLVQWPEKELVLHVYFTYQAPNGEKVLMLFWGFGFFFALLLAERERERKKSKQYKVLKNASCQLCCEITWRLNVNHCSMFSNLDFAKVTLKTLMLFAVFTAKTADVLLGY